MAEMNINDNSLDALYQMASRFLGYSGPKSKQALEDFAKSSPAAASKLGAYSSAMAKGGLVREFNQGGSVIRPGVNAAGERLWVYGGKSYKDLGEATKAYEDALKGGPNGTPAKGGVILTNEDGSISWSAGLGTGTVPKATTSSLNYDPSKAAPIGNEQQVTSLGGGKWSYGGRTYDDYMTAFKAKVDTAKESIVQQDMYKTYQAEQAQSATADPTATLENAKKNFSKEVQLLANYKRDLDNLPEGDPRRVVLEGFIETQEKKVAASQSQLSLAQAQFSATNIPSAGEVVGKASTDPMSMVTSAKVTKLKATPETLIKEGTGQVGEITPVEAQTVEQPELAVMPEVFEAKTIEATQISDEVKAELADLEAAKGTVSKEGTVRGQLEILMEDFENDGTPPWASGAMRAAMGVMQARGLGASSMAGQAVVQAAMESAIAIASQDAQTVAQFELQNLNNEQQTLIFKTQQRVATMLSDQAAENAAKQFNASSENQTKQFFADLQSTVSRFNADQINAIRQFNTGQTNAMEQFNAQMKAARDQFNATNSLIVAQANAKWMQDISTANTAAANLAAREAAAQANALTSKAMDDILQRERDLLDYAFTASETEADRKLNLLLADKKADLAVLQQESSEDAAKGYLTTRIVSDVLFGGEGGGLLGSLS